MPAQRILIIKHGALGDVVLAMGTMKRLRELHPEAHITLMTMGMFVPMAEQLGVFDDFIVDNRLPYWKLGATWRAVRSIVRGNFDVVYDLQESSRTRKRYYPAVRFLLNHDMDWVACNSGERRKLLKKKSFRWGKVEREPFRLERVLTDLSFMHGEGLHFDELPERYVMMIPGCSPNHPYKRWPVENFCALAKRLAARGRVLRCHRHPGGGCGSGGHCRQLSPGCQFSGQVFPDGYSPDGFAFPGLCRQ